MIDEGPCIRATKIRVGVKTRGENKADNSTKSGRMNSKQKSGPHTQQDIGKAGDISTGDDGEMIGLMEQGHTIYKRTGLPFNQTTKSHRKR